MEVLDRIDAFVSALCAMLGCADMVDLEPTLHTETYLAEVSNDTLFFTLPYSHASYCSLVDGVHTPKIALRLLYLNHNITFSSATMSLASAPTSRRCILSRHHNRKPCTKLRAQFS
jgi:hypothetical protein